MSLTKVIGDRQTPQQASRSIKIYHKTVELYFLQYAGIMRSTVTGSRALDETRVGVVAGALGGVAVAFSSLSASLSAAQIWWFGIAAPAVVAGFAARYYTHLRRSWNEYWTRQEQSR